MGVPTDVSSGALPVPLNSHQQIAMIPSGSDLRVNSSWSFDMTSRLWDSLYPGTWHYIGWHSTHSGFLTAHSLLNYLFKCLEITVGGTIKFREIHQQGCHPQPMERLSNCMPVQILPINNHNGNELLKNKANQSAFILLNKLIFLGVENIIVPLIILSSAYYIYIFVGLILMLWHRETHINPQRNR